MTKITPEMRKLLRVPLPDEAVSPHPTKTYLSTIKSIYVAERINDVFGIGTWTLKGEPVEILEKNIVMRVVLEIPEYGFYGEAYGGNDNPDRGDAFKGAVTDGLTKIAAQQLEIGIDVFKGLHGKEPTSKIAAQQQEEPKVHWCSEHRTAFFKSSKMRSFAHPIGDTREWCYEHKSVEIKQPDPEQAEEEVAPYFDPKPVDKPPAEEVKSIIDMDWLMESLATLRGKKRTAWTEKNLLGWMKDTYKVEAVTVLEAVAKLDKGKAAHLVNKIQETLSMA